MSALLDAACLVLSRCLSACILARVPVYHLWLDATSAPEPKHQDLNTLYQFLGGVCSMLPSCLDLVYQDLNIHVAVLLGTDWIPEPGYLGLSINVSELSVSRCQTRYLLFSCAAIALRSAAILSLSALA